MPQTFISYRRDDSGYVVAHIRKKLSDSFGVDSVFTDVDNIPLGVDFRTHISSAVAECTVLLAVIGDDWAGRNAATSVRRIDDPRDFVRLEIEAALSRSIPVVPVLVEKAAVPGADDLPATMRDLAFRNAAEVRSGPYLEMHLEILCRRLSAYLLSPAGQSPSATPSAAESQTVVLPRGETVEPAATPTDLPHSPTPAESADSAASSSAFSTLQKVSPAVSPDDASNTDPTIPAIAHPDPQRKSKKRRELVLTVVLVGVTVVLALVFTKKPVSTNPVLPDCSSLSIGERKGGAMCRNG